MINVNKLIDVAKLGDVMILTDVEPAYSYEDGHVTDVVVGYKYTVVLPEMDYEKLSVKIAGQQPLLEKTDSVQYVVFKNLQLKAFSLEGQHTVRVSATADGIMEAN